MDESLYNQVGGQPFFDRLVDAFYLGVEANELLRSMYPDDLAESKRNLAFFLAQYWGGPPVYQHERGHPRLRMRHAPFDVTERARDAWLEAMYAALESVRDELSVEQLSAMTDYFAMAANQMRNA